MIKKSRRNERTHIETIITRIPRILSPLLQRSFISFFLIVGGIVCEISPVKISPWSRFQWNNAGIRLSRSTRTAQRAERSARRHREDLPRDRPVSRSVPTETSAQLFNDGGMIVDERSIPKFSSEVSERTVEASWVSPISIRRERLRHDALLLAATDTVRGGTVRDSRWNLGVAQWPLRAHNERARLRNLYNSRIRRMFTRLSPPTDAARDRSSRFEIIDMNT